MGLKETGQRLYSRIPVIGRGEESLLGEETRAFLGRIELHEKKVEALFNLNTDPFKLEPAHKAFLSLFIQESIAINLVSVPSLDKNLPHNLSVEYPQLWDELDGHFDKNHKRIEETYGLSTLRAGTIENFRQRQHPLIEVAEKLSSFYFDNQETQPNQREKQDTINECTELVEMYKELLSNSDLSWYVRTPWIENLKHMAGKNPTLTKIFSLVALLLLAGVGLEAHHLTKQDEEKDSSKPAMVFPATLPPPPYGDVFPTQTPAPVPIAEPSAEANKNLQPRLSLRRFSDSQELSPDILDIRAYLIDHARANDIKFDGVITYFSSNMPVEISVDSLNDVSITLPVLDYPDLYHGKPTSEIYLSGQRVKGRFETFISTESPKGKGLGKVYWAIKKDALGNLVFMPIGANGTWYVTVHLSDGSTTYPSELFKR